MSKINKIIYNGTEIVVDDPDSLSKPDGEPMDGCTIVYRNGKFVYDKIETNLNFDTVPTQDSQNLVDSNGIYLALQQVKQYLSEVRYNILYSKSLDNTVLTFSVESGTLLKPIQILILCINIDYDNNNNDLSLYKCIDTIELNEQNSSRSITIGNYAQSRQFKFLLINNHQYYQTCLLNVDGDLIAGTGQTVTNNVITPAHDPATSKLMFTAQQNVDVPVNITVRLVNENNENVGSYLTTILQGGSYAEISIPKSGENRTANYSIDTGSQISLTQNIILSTNSTSIAAQIVRVPLITVPNENASSFEIRVDPNYTLPSGVDPATVIPITQPINFVAQFRNSNNNTVITRTGTFAVGSGATLYDTCHCVIDYTGISFDNYPFVDVVFNGVQSDATKDFYFAQKPGIQEDYSHITLKIPGVYIDTSLMVSNDPSNGYMTYLDYYSQTREVGYARTNIPIYYKVLVITASSSPLAEVLYINTGKYLPKQDGGIAIGYLPDIIDDGHTRRWESVVGYAPVLAKTVGGQIQYVDAYQEAASKRNFIIDWSFIIDHDEYRCFIYSGDMKHWFKGPFFDTYAEDHPEIIGG